MGLLRVAMLSATFSLVLGLSGLAPAPRHTKRITTPPFVHTDSPQKREMAGKKIPYRPTVLHGHKLRHRKPYHAIDSPDAGSRVVETVELLENILSRLDVHGILAAKLINKHVKQVVVTSPKILRSLVLFEFNSASTQMPIASPGIVLPRAGIWDDDGGERQQRRPFAHAVSADGVHHIAYDLHNTDWRARSIVPLEQTQLELFFLPHNTPVRVHVFNYRQNLSIYKRWAEFIITVKGCRLGELVGLVTKMGVLLSDKNVLELTALTEAGEWKRELQVTEEEKRFLVNDGEFALSTRVRLDSEHPDLSEQAVKCARAAGTWQEEVNRRQLAKTGREAQLGAKNNRGR
ncbi:unnamed protein product [Zymoseptoria tritici ST99CH_1A5]|uniref:F-box domain-containing protein n=1 Tax=Zymoseptoria tritici ST99CH_1A5 TaxID=1276529 RepID=A0A1Y6LQH4_ZYMTR|nr:unnamed protein product [Zymoseptoria tritici ST99CH_1A5]